MPQVILADKSDLFRRSLTSVLGREGYDVVTSETGARTLNLIKQQIPSALILDVEVENPSGLEILSWIKSDPKFKRIPVLVVSRDGAPSAVSNAFRLGAESFLLKPIELNVLLKTLNRLKVPVPAFNAPIELVVGAEQMVGKLRFTDQYGLVYLDKDTQSAFAPVGMVGTLGFEVDHLRYLQRVMVTEENEQGIALFPVGAPVKHGSPELAHLAVHLKARYLMPPHFMRLAEVVALQADGMKLKGIASEPKFNAAIQLTLYPPASGTELGGIALKGKVVGFQAGGAGSFDLDVSLDEPLPLAYIELLAEQMSGRPIPIIH